MKENPQSRLPTLRLADGTAIYNSRGDLRIFRHAAYGREAVSGEVSRSPRGAAPPCARRRHARHDDDVARRGDLRPPQQQSIKHMQAWKLKTNVSVDALENEADALSSSRILDRPHRASGSRSATSISVFAELNWRDGHPKLAAWHERFRGAALRTRHAGQGRAVIHHHQIGDARITGVIEYSGPTHEPDFLYPDIDKAERDAVLKANASWLAPNHYAPSIDRLIVTIQLWVVRRAATSSSSTPASATARCAPRRRAWTSSTRW